MLAPRGKLPHTLALVTLLGICTNFPEGYSNSFPNTSFLSFRNQINETFINRGHENGINPKAYSWLWSAILNVWFVGYLIGTVLTPFVTESYGRKKALLLANAMALVGGVMSFFGVWIPVPELFFASRVFQACSSGLSFGALILFLQETASTEYRGMVSFLCETTFIGTSVLGVGFGMDAVFGNNLPLLAGIAIGPAVLSILLLIPLEETPKFLLLKRNDREAARRALVYYQGECYAETDELLEEMLREKVDGEKRPLFAEIWTVLTQQHLRTPFFCGLLTLQLVVGIWPLMYISTDILEENFTLETAQFASLGLISINFIAGVVGVGFIERFGRRTLVLTLGTLCTLSLAAYVLCDQLTKIDTNFRWGTIAALAFFDLFYGMGIGPIAFFVTSEMVGQQYRSIVQSMVFAANCVLNAIFSFVTLPAFEHWQSWSFIPLFIVPSIFSLIYLAKYMPETADREVHDVMNELLTRTRKYSVKRSTAPLNIAMSLHSASLSTNNEKATVISS